MIYSVDGHTVPSIARRSANDRNPPKINTWSGPGQQPISGPVSGTRRLITVAYRLLSASTLTKVALAHFLGMGARRQCVVHAALTRVVRSISPLAFRSTSGVARAHWGCPL